MVLVPYSSRRSVCGVSRPVSTRRGRVLGRLFVSRPPQRRPQASPRASENREESPSKAMKLKSGTKFKKMSVHISSRGEKKQNTATDSCVTGMCLTAVESASSQKHNRSDQRKPVN